MDTINKKALVVRSYYGKGNSGEHIEAIEAFIDTPENRQAAADRWLNKEGYSQHQPKQDFLNGTSNRTKVSEDGDWDDPTYYELTVYSMPDLMALFLSEHAENMRRYSDIYDKHTEGSP